MAAENSYPANFNKVIQARTLRNFESQFEEEIEQVEEEEELARQQAELEKGGKFITPITKSIPAIRRTKPRPVPAKGGKKDRQAQSSDPPQQIDSDIEEGSGEDDEDYDDPTDAIDGKSDGDQGLDDLPGEQPSVQGTTKRKERAVDLGSDDFSDNYYDEDQNNAGDDKFYFHQKNKTVNPERFVMTAGHFEQARKYAKREGIRLPAGFVPKVPVFYTAGLVPLSEDEISSAEDEAAASKEATARQQQLAAFQKQKKTENDRRKREFKKARDAQNRGEVVAKNTLILNNEERLPHNFPRLSRSIYKEVNMLRRLPTPAEEVSYLMERNEKEGYSSDHWDLIMPNFQAAIESVLVDEDIRVPSGAAPHICLPMYIMFDGQWVESHPKSRRILRYMTWWDASKDGPNAKRLIDQETRKKNKNSMLPYATTMKYFKYEFLKMGLFDEYTFHRNKDSDPAITFNEIIFRYSTLVDEREFDHRFTEHATRKQFRLSVLPPCDEEGNPITEAEMWKKVVAVFQRSTMDVDHDTLVFEFGIEGQWQEYDPAREVVLEMNPDAGEDWEDLYDE